MKFDHKKNFWERDGFDKAHLSKLILDNENCNKVCKWWENKKDFLVFLGLPGTGKTYLVSALIHEWKQQYPSIPFRYFSCSEFFSRLRHTISQNWDYEKEIKTLCECPLFFLDDLRTVDLNEWQMETLQIFLDERHQLRFPTFISSNLFLKDLKSIFHSRFMSRLCDSRNTIIELISQDLRQTER